MSRRLHVAGSAHRLKTAPDVLRYAHEVVQRTVAAHVASGGTVLCQLGDDPRHESADDLRCLFDWTVLESCLVGLEEGAASAQINGRPLVHAVCSTTGRGKVSTDNEHTLSALRDAGALDISTLPELWRSGALIRQVQARFGEALLTIGGAVGVEHLAELYAQEGKPIIPLDIAIGSFYEDSRRGGEWLAVEARTRPDAFLEVSGIVTAAARLDAVRTEPGSPSAEALADNVTALLRALRPQTAFFVRLLNNKSKDFDDVEWFFRSVVDDLVLRRGLQRVEVGTDPSSDGFINSEIFTKLHYADVAIVDMTGQRPNCAIELGYALARAHPVILCARDGDGTPPFDVDALPFFFWDRARGETMLRAALETYWNTHAARAPVVSTRSMFGLAE
jgi:hypothetical protein